MKLICKVFIYWYLVYLSWSCTTASVIGFVDNRILVFSNDSKRTKLSMASLAIYYNELAAKYINIL